jgi:hypothetical protein
MLVFLLETHTLLLFNEDGTCHLTTKPCKIQEKKHTENKRRQMNADSTRYYSQNQG